MNAAIRIEDAAGWIAQFVLGVLIAVLLYVVWEVANRDD